MCKSGTSEVVQKIICWVRYAKWFHECELANPEVPDLNICGFWAFEMHIYENLVNLELPDLLKHHLGGSNILNM